jgi:hypothetical protein
MKIFQGLGALVSSALVVAGLIVAPSASGSPGPIKLSIESIATPNVQVMGGRGAALARLSDGRLLLGGGNNGFSLYLYDLATEGEVLLGRVANQSD